MAHLAGNPTNTPLIGFIIQKEPPLFKMVADFQGNYLTNSMMIIVEYVPSTTLTRMIQ